MKGKPSFRSQVLRVVAKIPAGQVMTYQQVAKLSGHPLWCRAVGSILKTNFDPHIPCHRVIKSDGTLGGYNRGPARKRRILKAEKFKFV
ncbi:MAG: MGMT family protein [Candidatus Paceibacterota bacterium]